MRNSLSNAAVIVLLTLSLIFLFNILFKERWKLPSDVQRARIIEVTPEKDGSVALVVRLNSQKEIAVTVYAQDKFNPEAQIVCVSLFGEPDALNFEARYEEMSECPLPVTRTVPLSGANGFQTTVGGKSANSLSTFGQDGVTGGQFPNKKLFFKSP